MPEGKEGSIMKAILKRLRERWPLVRRSTMEESKRVDSERITALEEDASRVEAALKPDLGGVSLRYSRHWGDASKPIKELLESRDRLHAYVEAHKPLFDYWKHQHGRLPDGDGLKCLPIIIEGVLDEIDALKREKHQMQLAAERSSSRAGDTYPAIVRAIQALESDVAKRLADCGILADEAAGISHAKQEATS